VIFFSKKVTEIRSDSQCRCI